MVQKSLVSKIKDLFKAAIKNVSNLFSNTSKLERKNIDFANRWEKLDEDTRVKVSGDSVAENEAKANKNLKQDSTGQNTPKNKEKNKKVSKSSDSKDDRFTKFVTSANNIDHIASNAAEAIQQRAPHLKSIISRFSSIATNAKKIATTINEKQSARTSSSIGETQKRTRKVPKEFNQDNVNLTPNPTPANAKPKKLNSKAR